MPPVLRRRSSPPLALIFPSNTALATASGVCIAKSKHGMNRSSYFLWLWKNDELEDVIVGYCNGRPFRHHRLAAHHLKPAKSYGSFFHSGITTNDCFI